MQKKMHKKMYLKKESPVQSVQPCWFQKLAFLRFIHYFDSFGVVYFWYFGAQTNHALAK